MIARHHSSSRQNGFTLVEIAVSVFILALLVSVVIANFRRGQMTDDLRRAAEQLVGDLRLLQTHAVTGRDVGPFGDVPPGGYGIAIDWSTTVDVTDYVIFADFESDDKGSGCQPVSSVPGDAGFDPDCVSATGDHLIEGRTVVLPPFVEISNIVVGGTTIGALPTDLDDSGLHFFNVLFQAPKPTPIANGTIGQTIHIELAHQALSDNSKFRTVTIIGATGQVVQERGGI